MRDSASDLLFQSGPVTPPTPSCPTETSCTQSGCGGSLEQGRETDIIAGFAAPSQHQNSTQTYQAAPNFLC